MTFQNMCPQRLPDTAETLGVLGHVKVLEQHRAVLRHVLQDLVLCYFEGFGLGFRVSEYTRFVLFGV
jgi:hypothetical protein